MFNKVQEKMAEEWSLQTFLNIWNDQGWSKAVEYKNNFVPSNLYKYCLLFDNNYSHYRKKNAERLMSLQEKYLWVSNYKFLNDPFEFKTLYLDHERIAKHGWNTDDLENCLELVKCSTQVCCFSNYGISNLPLWAHYANNHKGYCIEYAVIDKTPIYPITYISKREPTATIPTKICSELRKGFEKNKKPSRDLWKYLIVLYMTFSCKFEHWRYEDEFRFFNFESNIDEGTSINITKANLNIDKIYIGIYCEYRIELIKIGKDLGCEVHEMFFDDYSQKFALQSKRII